MVKQNLPHQPSLNMALWQLKSVKDFFQISLDKYIFSLIRKKTYKPCVMITSSSNDMVKQNLPHQPSLNMALWQLKSVKDFFKFRLISIFFHLFEKKHLNLVL